MKWKYWLDQQPINCLNSTGQCSKARFDTLPQLTSHWLCIQWCVSRMKTYTDGGKRITVRQCQCDLEASIWMWCTCDISMEVKAILKCVTGLKKWVLAVAKNGIEFFGCLFDPGHLVFDRLNQRRYIWWTLKSCIHLQILAQQWHLTVQETRNSRMVSNLLVGN